MAGFHLDFGCKALDNIESLLKQALTVLHDNTARLERIETKMNKLDQEISDLVAEVTAEKTVEDSLIAAFKGVPALIQAAVDAAIAKGATDVQLQAIVDVKNAIHANAQTMADAVVAGTQPAGPGPV